MRICFLGDIHGKFNMLYKLLKEASDKYNISSAFQIGDFGISKKIFYNTDLKKLPVPLYFIDGNHEDFKFINTQFNKDMEAELQSKNLYYQRRGTIAEISSIKAGFIGGALNVDRHQQRKDGNIITNDEVNKALSAFTKTPPEIIVSHSCPAGIGIGMRGRPSNLWGVANYIILAGYNPGPALDYGELQLTDLWERLPIRPKLWIFGHFHKLHQYTVADTLFICLPRLDIFSQILIWDTDAQQICIETLI